MPQAEVGLVLNFTELACTIHKLSRLSRSVGGKRLRSIVSLRNAGVQVLTGMLIKGTVSILFLGNEVNMFLDTAHQSTEEVSAIGVEDIGAAEEFSNEMFQMHPSAETIDLASTPPDEYENSIALENEFASSNMDGEMEIRGGDPVSPGGMLIAGACAAASDIVIKNVAETPLDDRVKRLANHKNDE